MKLNNTIFKLSCNNYFKFFSLFSFILLLSLSAYSQCQQPQLSAATGIDFNQITLTWTGVSGSSSSYKVYGSNDGGNSYGDPLTRIVNAGQAEQFDTNHWGVNASLETNKTYHFYITTVCSGTIVQSDTVTATTRDIETPVLSAVQGDAYEEIDLTFTAVAGANLTYQLFGSPDPNGPWDSPQTLTFNQWGEQKTFSLNHYKIAGNMQTYQTYYFYVVARAGAYTKDSNTASATTRDIAKPVISLIKHPTYKATLEWNPVAANYTIETFSTITGWGFWSNDDVYVNGKFIYDDPWTIGLGNIRRYRIRASRSGRVRYSNTVTAYFAEGENLGIPNCNMGVGKPVNISNGNMYLSHTDFTLQGLGDFINVARSYNSQSNEIGIFGSGWSSPYDVYLIKPLNDDYTLKILMEDGRSVYFARTDLSEPFISITPDFRGIVNKNTNESYTLTFKDGMTNEFDSLGKLLSKKDRNGNETTLNYSNGILTGITDADGRTLNINMSNGLVQNIIYDSEILASYTYNSDKLNEVTYQDGSKYKFLYKTITLPSMQVLNVIETVKDALDNIIEEHAYDTAGRATTSEIDGGNEKYTLDYSQINAAIPYTSVIDGLGRTTTYYFDKSRGRNVTTKIEGNCNCGGGAEVTEFEFDDKLNVKKQTDAIGRETTYTYDNQGNPLTMTDTWGTVTNTFNSYGQILTSTDRMGGVWTLTYDAKGNLTSLDDPITNVEPNPNSLGITTITYPTIDNKGLPISITDARGRTTNLLWFSTGLLQQITDANSKVTKFTYDVRSRIKTVENALTHTTQYNYFNDSQRKVEVIYPNLDKITYKYDIRRLLETVTDARGKITTYDFDDAYRLTKITDPLGHYREYGYDLMSNMTSHKDPLGNVTNYKYDNFDRLEEVKYPLITTEAARLKVNYSYDDIGRIKTFSDTAQRITTYNYDDVNRINEVINAELESTKVEYNQRFQTVKVTDAQNQIYNFTHDALGRMLSNTRAGTSQTYEYDEVGNRTKRFDHLGRLTIYEYDNLNRLEHVKYFNKDTNNVQNLSYQSDYVYDDISRLTSATNYAGTVSFTYDNVGRTTSTTDVHGQTVAYEYIYNSTVNQKNLKLNGTLHAIYNFDDANRMTSLINSSDNTTTTFTYDNADRLTIKTLPNNVNTVYTYDQMSRLTRLKDSNSTATLFDRQYSYNSANQISQITEPNLTRTFNYDNVNRLTGVTASNSANESYTYDNVGNRTNSHLFDTYNYQANNRVTSASSTTNGTINYGYNSNGAMTLKSEKSNLWRYVWDHENRLRNASKRKERVDYKYDALGRRVETSGFIRGVTKYTYDGLDVIQDDDSRDGITKYQNGLGIDTKLRMQNGSDVNYFLSDHLGSTNGLADSTGAITSQTSYDSFGNPTSNINTRYQFTGREKDDVTDLYYYRARQYDSKLGRFISEDPIGFAGGDVNLYGYVWNNPISFTDPLGLEGGWGSNTADWLDDRFDTAEEFYGFDPPIAYTPGIGTHRFFGTLRGLSDLFRVGNGTAQAIYCEDNIYGQTAFVLMDVQRASVIFSMIAGPAAGRFGGVKPKTNGEIPHPSNPANIGNTPKFKKSLASKQQMDEVGEIMAGSGSKKPFRDSPRVASQYGGNAGDWAKMRSSSYTSSEVGGMQQFETHWVQNVKTGQRVEFKTKFPRLKK